MPNFSKYQNVSLRGMYNISNANRYVNIQRFTSPQNALTQYMPLVLSHHNGICERKAKYSFRAFHTANADASTKSDLYIKRVSEEIATHFTGFPSIVSQVEDASKSSSIDIGNWDYSLEDERGLRFGNAYMLLLLAWNRKFNRIRDILVNANRSKEGAKQALISMLNQVCDESNAPNESSSNGIRDFEKVMHPLLYNQLRESIAFIRRNNLKVTNILNIQKAVVSRAYGIVGCTRGSNTSNLVLMDQGSLYILLPKADMRKQATVDNLNMRKERTIDFESALATAERLSKKPDSEVKDGEIAENPWDALYNRRSSISKDIILSLKEEHRIRELQKKPMTLRQFRDICTDCGVSISRGFAVQLEIKLLCKQQFSIANDRDDVIAGCEDPIDTIHTLRFELNAKFDSTHSNIFFPAFEPTSWNLIDWNYAVGPSYPFDPTDCSNVSYGEETSGPLALF